MQALTKNNGSLTNNIVTSIAILQQQMNVMQTSMQNSAMAGTAHRLPQQLLPNTKRLPKNKLILNSITHPLNTNSSSKPNTSPPIILTEDVATEEAEDKADKEAAEDVVDEADIPSHHQT